MRIDLNHQVHSFGSDRTHVPNWHQSVDRWYQLDEAAYGLVDTYFHCLSKLFSRPDFIILASPAASNHTDFEFVKSGAISPSLFVHTLPNIRSAPLLQAMEWTGPILCLQAGIRTLLSGCVEAIEMAARYEQNVWILSVFQNRKDQQNEVHILELLGGKRSTEKKPNYEVVLTDSLAKYEASRVDSDLIHWLCKRPDENEFDLSPAIKIARRNKFDMNEERN